MTKSCKSQGKRNKTMKKNTKKMQGGTDGNDANISSTGVLPQVGTAAQVDPIVAAQVGPNSTTTATAKPVSQGSFFSFEFPSLKLPSFFSSVPKPTTGGKRKSKSNKSYKKKSKYNKK